MATYEYRCASCDRDFAVTRPIGTSEIEVCPWPLCEGRGIRVITAPSVVVKDGTKAGYVRR